MENKKTILVIEGTNRKDRQSIKVANLIVEVGNSLDGVEVVLVDPNDLKMMNDGNKEESRHSKYTELTEKADGFFMVIPEYNHSFPPSLKRIVDSEYDNYYQKPVALAGVSGGPWGGTRAIESFVSVGKATGMLMIKGDIQFPFVTKLFDENGKITDEKYVGRVKKIFEELLGLVERLG